MKQKQRDLFNQEKYPPRDPQELKEKFPNLNTAPGWNEDPHKIWKRPGDPYLTPLSGEDIKYAGALADRLGEAWKKNKARYTMDTDEKIKSWSFLIGCLGKVAVAKHYDLVITDFLDRWGETPDFGPRKGPGIYVRTTNATFTPGIPVHPQNDPKSITIRVCEFSTGLYRIHAWCLNSDAIAYVALTNPKPFGDVPSAPVHMVACSAEIAHIMGGRGGDIPPEFLTRCPRGYRPWSY